MTTNPLRFARGTNASISARALLAGEVAFNTDTKRVHVGDGTTLGGLEQAIALELETFLAEGTTEEISFAGWAALNGLWPEQFGTNVGSGGDDYAALAAFFNAVMASEQRVGKMQRKRYKTSQALPKINVPGVKIYGSGPGPRSTDQTLVGTIIEATAAMDYVIDIAPDEGAARRLSDVEIDGISIDCNGFAEVGLWARSLTECKIGVRCDEATVVGLKLGVVASLTGDTRNMQDVTFRYYGVQLEEAAPCYELDGDDNANISYCTFELLVCIHKDEAAGYHRNSDNNSFSVCRTFDAGGSATNSIVWEGGDSALSACRGEWYDVLYTSLPAIAKGTGSFTTGAYSILIENLDLDNNSAIPVVEAGAHDIIVLNGGFSTVTAATTTDLSRAPTNNVVVDGSGQTITGLGASVSARRIDVRFNGANTLTHNGTSLILPGGANITTADGDTMSVVSLAAGNWRVVRYTKAAFPPYALATAAQAKEPTNDTVALTPENLLTDLGVWRVLAASAVQVSHTGDTNETVLATITIPANAIGANGQIRVWPVFTMTGTNSKTVRVRLGGSGGTAFQARAHTTNTEDASLCRIANRNSTASQVGYAATSFGLNSTAAGSVATASIDTTVAQDLVITGQLTNTGEAVRLESYVVEVFYKA